MTQQKQGWGCQQKSLTWASNVPLQRRPNTYWAVWARLDPACQGWLLPSVWHLWDHTWGTVSVWGPQHKSDNDILQQVQQRLTLIERGARVPDGQGEVERAEFLQCDRRRLKRETIAVFDYILGIHRRNRAKFLWGTQWQSERKWTQIARREIPTRYYGKKIITGQLNTWILSPRDRGISILRDIYNSSIYNWVTSSKLAPRWLGGWLGWMISWGPFRVKFSVNFPKIMIFIIRHSGKKHTWILGLDLLQYSFLNCLPGKPFPENTGKLAYIPVTALWHGRLTQPWGFQWTQEGQVYLWFPFLWKPPQTAEVKNQCHKWMLTLDAGRLHPTR